MPLLTTFNVGNATITLGIDGVDPLQLNKTRIAYNIRLPFVPGSAKSYEKGRIVAGNELSVLARDTDGETIGKAYGSLLSFLGAAAEQSDSAYLFPADVTEWARQYSDEIAMTACELEDEFEDI